ncbi:MAG TPA: hypothetical protein VN048_11530 [Verrucomicrobiae bacterium]|nr:hypothetical protein [Verrucomicrobiae bacterium]
MKTRFFLIAVMIMSLAGLRPAVAQDASADSRPAFNSFQVIEQNNIFNPSRRPPRHIGPIVPVVRVYSFTLNGTMSYENKGYAFFDGNAVNRGNVFGLSDTINGYKIAEITNNTVKLAAASNQFITLKVGMQMKKVENGPWKLVGSSEPAAESTSSSSGSTDASSDDNSGDATAATAPVNQTPGADADVIARLLKRHREENGDTNAAPANGN